MIEIHKSASDDPEFLQIVTNFIEGLGQNSGARELHLVHIDNWFDHKWLGFAGKTLGAAGVRTKEERLTIPAFNPGRVLAHQLFTRAGSAWTPAPAPKPIHLKIGSEVNLKRRVSEVTGSAALVWYTSNTVTNGQGAVMAYVPTEASLADPNPKRMVFHTWYISLAKKGEWTVNKSSGLSKSAFLELTETRPSPLA